MHPRKHGFLTPFLCFLFMVSLAHPCRGQARSERSERMITGKKAKKPKESQETWFLKDRGEKVTDEGFKTSGAAKVALYPVNRVADFLDIFTLNLGFGLGLHVNVHGTRALPLGGGAAMQSKLGTDGRYIGIAAPPPMGISWDSLWIRAFGLDMASRSGLLNRSREHH